MDKTVKEQYEYTESAAFTQKYGELKDIGDVKLHFVRVDNPTSVSTNFCEIYGHDWNDTNDDAAYELSDSTKTVTLTKLIKKEGSFSKTSKEFIKKQCSQCWLKEFWSYETTVNLIKRVGE